MSTSGKLGIVLGTQRMSVLDLNDDERLELLNHVLGLLSRARPLPELKPLLEHMSCSHVQPRDALRKSGVDVEYGRPMGEECMDSGTRCLFLVTVRNDSPKPSDLAGQEYTVLNLLMTQSGNAVVWEYRYIVRPGEQVQRPSFCSFYPPTPEQLRSYATVSTLERLILGVEQITERTHEFAKKRVVAARTLHNSFRSLRTQLGVEIRYTSD